MTLQQMTCLMALWGDPGSAGVPSDKWEFFKKIKFVPHCVGLKGLSGRLYILVFQRHFDALGVNLHVWTHVGGDPVIPSAPSLTRVTNTPMKVHIHCLHNSTFDLKFGPFFEAH